MLGIFNLRFLNQEKRIETLEKEVKHLKAVLQYQMRNKKK